MAIQDLEKIDHGQDNYNLREKLWVHVTKRSEVCFSPKPMLTLTCDSDFFCIESADKVMPPCHILSSRKFPLLICKQFCA